MAVHFLKKITSVIISEPLSVLRILLSALVGITVYRTCSNIFNLPNNQSYEYNKTWITSLIPNHILEFDVGDFFYWKIFLLTTIFGAIFGLLGRLSLFALAFAIFVLYGVDESIGSFDHQLSFSSQILFILALVPGSMRLSLDNLIKSIYFKSKINFFCTVKKTSWGVNLILLLLIATYFTAGISKLRFGGTSYLDGETIGFYIQEHTFEYPKGEVKLIIGDSNLSEEEKWKDKYGLQAYAYSNIQSSKKIRKIQYWVSNKPLLLKLITMFSIVFELAGFIVFFGSKYRNIYLLCAIMFHTTIGILMGFTFYQYRLVCLCLIDWKYLYTRSYDLIKFITFKRKEINI